MNINQIVNDVKLSLSIEDNLSDTLIVSITNRIESAVKTYINELLIPQDLEWVVIEATITRFGLLGSEAKTSESIEGLSNTYKTDPLTDYYSYLNAWCTDNKTSGKKSNRVRFL